MLQIAFGFLWAGTPFFLKENECRTIRARNLTIFVIFHDCIRGVLLISKMVEKSIFRGRSELCSFDDKPSQNTFLRWLEIKILRMRFRYDGDLISMPLLFGSDFNNNVGIVFHMRKQCYR